MSNSETKRIEVFAWVAKPKQASKVTDKELAALKRLVGEQLAVEYRHDGSLILYTSDQKTKKKLDDMVALAGLFHEQKIYVDTSDDRSTDC